MNLNDSYDRMVERSGESRFSPGVVGEKPKTQMISLDLLNIDESYQRFLSRRVLDKAKQFDYALARPLFVFRRPNGEFYVVDGQHTALMGLKSGIVKEMECTVLEHDENLEEEECRKIETNFFQRLNSSRKNVSLIDRYRCGASLNEDWAMDFVNFLKDLELKIEGLGDEDGWEVKSWAKLENCWNNYPAYAFRKSVDFLKNVDKRKWEKGYLNGSLIVGVAMIFYLLECLGPGQKQKGLKYYMENIFENYSINEWLRGCNGSLQHYLLLSKIIGKYNDSLKNGNPGSSIGETTLQSYKLSYLQKQ